MRAAALITMVAAAGCGARLGPAIHHGPPRLPHALYRPSAGGVTPASDGELDQQLRAARAVYLGEQHDDPHQHAFELELLERVWAIDHSVGLGMEMLPASAQPALDEWLAGRIDEDTLLDRVAWERAWGYPFRWYRPLLEFCRAHRLPAYALNAPHELSKAIAHRGIEGLSDEQRRALPEMVPGPAEHRAQLEEAFRAHGGEAHKDQPTEALERFYLAQLLWDETMAEQVARRLAAPGAPRRLVVVAGDGHVKRWAIPLRAERRGVRPQTVILPLYRRDLDLKESPPADFLWVLTPSS